MIDNDVKEIRMISYHIENISKEIEIIKRNQIENSELKRKIHQMGSTADLSRQKKESVNV